MQPSKRRRMHGHLAYRIRSRYKTAPTERVANQILSAIQSGLGCIYVATLADERIEWLVRTKDGDYRVISEGNRQTIVTVLPMRENDSALLRSAFGE